MQIDEPHLTANQQEFKLKAYWLESSGDFMTPVDYPVVIICPGGGFQYHSARESDPIALQFLAEGFHAIVLPYQLVTPKQTVYPTALHQLARTIEWVSEQAGKRPIDLERIILTGFSAGGHVVATYNSVATTPTLKVQYQLNQYRGEHAAIILHYPVIDLDAGFPQTVAAKNAITPDTTLWHAQQTLTKSAKPAFVWQTATDATVPAINSLLYVTALYQLKIPTEYHLFSEGVHGLALANHVTQRPGKTHDLNAPVAQWFPLVVTWLKAQHLIQTH